MDCLTYMRQVIMHTLDYVDAAILPVEELRIMLRHIKAQLPPIMNLPISSDIHHFYQYLNTHIQVADGQFLLLIDVPIQDRGHQLQVYEIFNLPVLHGEVSAKYEISDKYKGITYDEMQAVMITEQTHQHA